MTALVAILLAACSGAAFDEDDDVAEVIVGGRLFADTRFSQFFFAHAKGQVNRPLDAGDPVMERSVGACEDLPGPFAGRSMNCRACHLVNEHLNVPGGSVRTYTDYARRSPIPARGDGATVTARRSPVLVNSTVERCGPVVLHADGEFASIEALIRGTLTGRNFGWLPTETRTAVKHLADVIRKDDGSDLFAMKTARLSYAVLFKGSDPTLAPFVQIPEAYRLDVRKATDDQILDAVAKLLGAYVDSLRFGVFQVDLGAQYAGSPYDAFLAKNGLPLRPEKEEAPIDYARRLRGLLEALTEPAWVSNDDWGFKLHNQPYQFGPRQLNGLRVFLSESGSTKGRVGNCVACHTPPAFSDYTFHNTGVAQEEYDEVHGDGAFAALKVPTRTERAASPERHLPATPLLPSGQGPFRAVPSAPHPGLTDLGLWNVYLNDAMPEPQAALKALLGNADLEDTIALFKTATVRDLGQAGPYFHTGRKDGIDAVLRHYVRFPELARAGKVRNADPKLREITITGVDLDALQAFLRSLNEDYND
ncbi:MAG TPA: hypothetical protein VE981_09540 [Planctomycetota bacterium]|nr:hypothetical protein [Planctomycetota bacterium]